MSCLEKECQVSIRSVLHARGPRQVEALARALGRALPVCLSLAAPAAAQVIPAAPPSGLPAEAPGLRAGGQPFDPGPELMAVLAQSGGLTATEAARRAARESVEAGAKHEQVVAAQAARQRVIWQAAPRVTLTGRSVLLSEVETPTIEAPGFEGFAFPQPRTNHSLNAGVTLPLSDYLLRTVKALRGASSNRAAAVLEERAARVTAAANAKLGYYDWVRARLQGVLAEQALVQAGAQLARMRALYAVGRTAEADLLQSEAFEAEAQLAVSQAQTQVTIAEERLRVAIGVPPGEPLSIGENVLAEFDAASEAKGVEELYREALAGRLEIQALMKSRAALDDLSSIEATRALPSLEAFGNFTYANPNQRIFPLRERWSSTWDAGVQLVWALNDVGTADAEASSVASQSAQLLYQQTGLERALRVEVVGALGALGQARLNVVTARQGERAAAAAYAARERLQEQGMGTALELMQAETARTQARLSLIGAHIALRVARVQLDHAVGRDVPQGWGAP